MAHYSYEYSCGHGEGTVVLFGKNEERERKLEWLRHNSLCPECYKKKMAEKNAAMGLVMQVSATTHPSQNIVISFIGDTLPVKDIIKSLGYRFDEIQDGFVGFLSVKAPAKGWTKTIHYAALEDECNKIKTAGLEPTYVNRITAMDEALMRETAKRDAEKAAKRAEIQRPEKPGSYPKGYWNQKFYSNNRIYVDNNERKLSEEDVAEIKKYFAALAEYKRKIAAIED